ncbi:uncharacterized protein Ecym_2756 [Eremothecium cymbalariae DBVPG|uniref:Uncharacterized protein n=1 Tax=Eremothecium cymbalariae (strain CBS 270.75 / DBVPG 7215 / KCTC 17166 / NRRL Y-17582) TaxID=931890 RepID=G8JPZ2_ERECY|nr:Hypothetical protein Ecym_2756 [Eremothecium cymbalariae DBVPG\
MTTVAHGHRVYTLSMFPGSMDYVTIGIYCRLIVCGRLDSRKSFSETENLQRVWLERPSPDSEFREFQWRRRALTTGPQIAVKSVRRAYPAGPYCRSVSRVVS